MRPKRTYIILWWLAAVLLPATAQNAPSFKVWVEHDTTGWIGDELTMKLNWECESPANVRFPVLQDEFANGLYILPQDSLIKQTSGTKGSVTYRFSGYEEKTYTLPCFIFEYARNGHLYRRYSDSGTVKLYAPEIDSTLDIKDIRGVFSVTRKELRKEYFKRFGFILWIVLALAALGAAAWWGYKLVKKHRAGKPLFKSAQPPVPPIDKALAALNLLKEKELWRNGFVKEYYTELTDILRVYLEEDMEIAAVEMTNEELCAALRACKGIDEVQAAPLIETLSSATLVKFAKAQPDTSCHEESFRSVQSFLNGRKQAGKETAKEAAKEAAPEQPKE